MKILYLHQHFASPKSAAGIRSYKMARAALAQGHQVLMVCGRGKDGQTGLSGAFKNGVRTGMVDGIEVFEIDLPYSNNDGFIKRSFTFIRFMMRTTKIVLTKNYDVIFATTTPLTVGVPGVLGRWIRRKPFIFEVRDLWPELPRAMGVIKNKAVLGALSILEWVSYRSADRLIGLSPGIVDGIKQRGVPQSRIKLIPNGCDIDIFGVDQEALRPPGVSQDDFFALFSGTHGIANGLDAVIAAAIELKKRGRNDIKLVLIGDGNQKKRLVDEAEKLKLDNIVFCDPVNKALLAKYMASADIGMQILANVPAFYYGTSPNKFFDYISSGLPTLINYPGWLADLVTEYKAGYVVPPDSPEAFATALIDAAADRVSVKQMGQNAFELAKNLFDRDELANQWVEWVTCAKNDAK